MSEEITEFPGTNLIQHKFPLRGDLDVRFILPRDLTEAEAQRIGAFMKTLVIEEEWD